MKVLIALVFCLLASLARAEVITYDMGGRLMDRIIHIEVLRGGAVPVRIEGVCVSACTLYLGLPKTCVLPTAVLGFHGPRPDDPAQPVDPATWYMWSRVMASYYPPQLRAWFMAVGRHMIGPEFIVMSGAQAIRLGARGCG